MFRIILLFAFALPALAAECATVSGDRIRAGELAAVLPGLDPAADLGPSPYPGVRRVFTRPQLERWRAAAGEAGARWPESLCVIRAAAPLDAARVRTVVAETLAALLPGETVDWEILDYPRQPLPAGELRFTRSGLSGAPGGRADAPLIWRGMLILPEKRSLAVWVKLRVAVSRSCALALAAMPAGAPADAAGFKVETRPVNPFGSGTECALPGEEGLVLRRALPAGAILHAADLRREPAVRRGDTVRVEWREGNAALAVPAVAEADGEPGRVIPLRLPENGRRLRGRVESKGRVTVETGAN